jgi:hypothetical protein
MKISLLLSRTLVTVARLNRRCTLFVISTSSPTLRSVGVSTSQLRTDAVALVSVEVVTETPLIVAKDSFGIALLMASRTSSSQIRSVRKSLIRPLMF